MPECLTTLAHTGSDIVGPAILALAVLVVGLVLTVARRPGGRPRFLRRHRSSTVLVAAALVAVGALATLMPTPSQAAEVCGAPSGADPVPGPAEADAILATVPVAPADPGEPPVQADASADATAVVALSGTPADKSAGVLNTVGSLIAGVRSSTGSLPVGTRFHVRYTAAGTGQLLFLGVPVPTPPSTVTIDSISPDLRCDPAAAPGLVAGPGSQVVLDMTCSLTSVLPPGHLAEIRASLLIGGCGKSTRPVVDVALPASLRDLNLADNSASADPLAGTCLAVRPPRGVDATAIATSEAGGISPADSFQSLPAGSAMHIVLSLSSTPPQGFAGTPSRVTIGSIDPRLKCDEIAAGQAFGPADLFGFSATCTLTTALEPGTAALVTFTQQLGECVSIVGPVVTVVLPTGYTDTDLSNNEVTNATRSVPCSPVRPVAIPD
ncbi:hypothetical protein [Leifsonia poae]|uniref:hypothetical protein n=1 Tax=Leifsonia poae TaxID=110933 RepID=UPI003D67DD0F